MSSSSASTITGSQLVAQTLKHHGISTVFGIIGIPVIEVGQACIDIGIRFVAFRNEQSAAYVSHEFECVWAIQPTFALLRQHVHTDT
jgi:2-hydroxyacyl-CoA lyase 1